jgi:hypothetical protein
MASKQKIIVSDYMADTAHRLKAQRALMFYHERPHKNVIKLSSEKNVELIESPDPRQEIKNIHKRFSKDTYEVIVKNLEDLRATMMDVG